MASVASTDRHTAVLTRLPMLNYGCAEYILTQLMLLFELIEHHFMIIVEFYRKSLQQYIDIESNLKVK